MNDQTAHQTVDNAVEMEIPERRQANDDRREQIERRRSSRGRLEMLAKKDGIERRRKDRREIKSKFRMLFWRSAIN